MRNNQRSIFSVLVFTLFLLTANFSSADELSGHIGGYVGFKKMNNYWPELEEHFSMGVLFDIKMESWPVSFVLDITDTGDMHSQNGLENLGHTTEYHLGLRKIFINQHSKIQPYVGGGVSFINAELEIETISTSTTQDDSSVGSWVGTGMYYEVNPRFVLGVDLRYSYGKVTLFNKERDAGGVHTGIICGFQF